MFNLKFDTPLKFSLKKDNTATNTFPFLPLVSNIMLELEPPPAPAPVANTIPVASQADYNTYNQNGYGTGRFAYKVHDENYNHYYTVWNEWLKIMALFCSIKSNASNVLILKVYIL